jgi:pimeloyl-ACP methyl ester carboxylesterase
MYETLVRSTAPMVRDLEVSSLHGRILTHPIRKPTLGRTIVFVYGIHGSLERFYGIVHYLALFGTIYVPDLPGFGGMDSFYQIGQKPTLDAFGDYLATVIAQELPEDTRLTLIGLSYGFVVITRMLARHPDLRSRVDLIISAMGLAEGSDIKMNFATRATVESLLFIGRTPVLGRLMQKIITNPITLRLTYTDRNPKMRSLPRSERPGYIAFESYLWKCNDMRTYGTSMHELLNYAQPDTHLDLPLEHIETRQDHWLDVDLAARHLRGIYRSVRIHTSAITNHGGVAYADEKEAEAIIPATVTKLLEQVS